MDDPDTRHCDVQLNSDVDRYTPVDKLRVWTTGGTSSTCAHPAVALIGYQFGSRHRYSGSCSIHLPGYVALTRNPVVELLPILIEEDSWL